MAATTLSISRKGNLVKIDQSGSAIIYESISVLPQITYHDNSTVDVVIGDYHSGAVPIAGLTVGGSSITSASDLDTAIALVWINTATATAQILVTRKTSVTSAQIKALNTTPITLVAAQGSGYAIQPLSVLFHYNYSTAAYATNTNLQVWYNGYTNNLITSNTVLLGVASTYSLSLPVSGTLTAADLDNKALVLTVLTGDPVTGAGTLDVYVTYALVTV